MAYLYIRTSLIKASSGKSAVASAAYMSAQTLHSERLGMTFQYRHKEEVVHSEILLPTSADEALRDRETLWNTVEEMEKKRPNARLARQYIMALPNSWTDEQAIQLCREFLQTELVDKGFAVDWALHHKDENLHIHAMVTPRKIQDGKWQNNKKSVYALDEDGNKIPELNADGSQKQRIRTRTINGEEYTTTENIWKRITIDFNELNSRRFLRDFKRSWVQMCNDTLTQEEKIDQRSFREEETNRVPFLHEGSEARAMADRGLDVYVIKENEERRQINTVLEQLEKRIEEAIRRLEELKERFRKWRQRNEERRGKKRNSIITAVSGDSGRNAVIHGRDDDRDGRGSIRDMIKTAAALEQRAQKIRKHRRRH